RNQAQLSKRLASQFVVCLRAPVENLRGLTRRLGRLEVAFSQKMALSRGLRARRGSNLSGFAFLGRSPIQVMGLLVDGSDAFPPVPSIQLGECRAEERKSAAKLALRQPGFGGERKPVGGTGSQ